MTVTSFEQGRLSLLRGRGDGTFAPLVTFPLAFDVSCVAIGDVDGDGRPDLVVTDSDGVSLLRARCL